MSEHQPSPTTNPDAEVSQSFNSSPSSTQLAQQESAGLDNSDSNDSPADDWQLVEFPNAISLEDIPGAVPESAQSIPSAAPSTADSSTEREAELLSLVRDLNECNDLLLTRVAQLETSLETAQTALQAEIERAQQSQDAAGLQQSQVTKAAQHQIAQLVGELDTAERALRRQQLLNETLQAELGVSQDRIAQLERECALVQQQHGEQSQALVHAEAACRDLRSRLQRQQRYTLQFKVALEKSLSASTQSSSAGLETHPTVEASAPVVMPKAQRIQPWASDPAPFEPVDPHLESLIRGLNARSQSAPVDISASPEPPTLDPEAETQLWQDLERVIDSSAMVASQNLDLLEDSLEDTLEVAKPALGQPLAEAVETSFEAAAMPVKPPVETVKAAFEADMAPGTQPADGSLPTENPFTEPSPWGPPLTAPPPPSGPEPTLPTAAQAAPSDPVPSPADPTDADYLPAMTPHGTGSSPAPVVYPLRPQKRVRSLSAVELPSFPKKAH